MAVRDTIIDLGGEPVEPLEKGAEIMDAINKGNLTPAEKVLGDSGDLKELQALLSSGVEITAEQRQMIQDKINTLASNIKNLKADDIDTLKNLNAQGFDAAGNALDKKKEEVKEDIEKNKDVSTPAIAKASKSNSGKSVGAVEQKTGKKTALKVSVKDLKDMASGGR